MTHNMTYGMAHIMGGQDAGANKSWRSMHNQSNKRGAAGRGVTVGEVHNMPMGGGVNRPPSSGMGPSAPTNSPEKVITRIPATGHVTGAFDSYHHSL